MTVPLKEIPLIPCIVIAGTASGVGKTTVVVGLIAAFRQRGLIVQPFKCGPDYIDPGYHTQAAGRPCRNLDAWMLNDDQVANAFARACQGADLAIIEGVMGLFDGSGYDDERGSAAHLAKLLKATVFLVMDIGGSARSVAATAIGFKRFDERLEVSGFVLNFAGSEQHAEGCRSAIEKVADAEVLGWLPRDEKVRVPERHLGLMLAGEAADTAKIISRLGSEVAQRFNLDRIQKLARPRSFWIRENDSMLSEGFDGASGRPILAVARDDAFAFYYPENIELLEAAGARIVFFRPAHGETLPPGTAGVYLGGGYPELHAQALSANTALWAELRALHAHGAPILAECGGFMVLTQALTDRAGTRWPMAGLIPGETRMTERLAGFGYREVTATRSNLLAEAGETLRGHEFHYSVWEGETDTRDRSAAWQARGTRADSKPHLAGYSDGSLLASYLHLHFGQRTTLAQRLVARLQATAILPLNP